MAATGEVWAKRGAAGLAALLLLSAGCARAPEPAPLAAGAINTGTYPNLNVLPPVAAVQLSAQDQAASRTELSAAQARQGAAGGAGGISPENQARLQRAQASQQETLTAIGGQP